MRAINSVYATLLLTTAATFSIPQRSEAVNPEYLCQGGRYKAGAKYAQCELKVTGKFLSGGNFQTFVPSLEKCRVKYAAMWAKLQAKATGTGSSCDVARFTVSAGTVVDALTGLQWEQKTDDGSIHDKDNLYAWSGIGDGTTPEADGAAFTDFLATLNDHTAGCFTGQCDWRLPSRTELQTILSAPCTTSPCIDEAMFGPTVANEHWTATTEAGIPLYAWWVNFADGDVGVVYKGNLWVRAVRGGL